MGQVSVSQSRSECTVEAPLGLIQLNVNELRAGGTARYTFEVLDIYDM